MMQVGTVRFGANWKFKATDDVTKKFLKNPKSAAYLSSNIAQNPRFKEVGARSVYVNPGDASINLETSSAEKHPNYDVQALFLVAGHIDDTLDKLKRRQVSGGQDDVTGISEIDTRHWSSRIGVQNLLDAVFSQKASVENAEEEHLNFSL